MGFTDGHPCMFSLEMKQSPETVRKVLDIAGLSAKEAEEAIGCDYFTIVKAMTGFMGVELPNDKWRLLLEKAGSRAFDHDEDAE